jgi:glutaminyl-tRNA synthetase
MNPQSLVVKQGYVERGLRDAGIDDRYQFEREGYFCLDRKHNGTGKLVFNRTVGLRDSWAKIEQKED